jgi:prepilin signal peptidase PulO-like enzyme (type II secretory pathway)
MYFFGVFVFIFGMIIGSFLNCLAWRLYKEESINGRSYCPKCRHQIAWYDNIPVLSYFLLGGECRHCKKAISWQYPIVELITAVLFVLAFFSNFQFPTSDFLAISDLQFPINFFTPDFLLLTFKNWFLISIMIIIFIIDLRWYLILDIVTLPACVIIFILNILLGSNWQNLIFSGIIGGSFFLLQFIISRGKWIGGGDIRLGLLMGLALGWPSVILALMLAYLSGSMVGIGLILSGRKKFGSQIPFGVFLSTATIISLFWGQIIINWYLNLL